MLLGVLWTIFTPRPVYADDFWDFLNPETYKTWQIKPATTEVDNNDWKVKLSNASCAVPIHVDLSMFVGQHDLYASVELCTTADFEIEFKRGNWFGTNIDTDIKKGFKLNKMQIFDTTSLNNLIGMIPYVGYIGGAVFQKQIVGGASAPCKIKGQFCVSAVYKIGYKDGQNDIRDLATADYKTDFKITSIEPTNGTPSNTNITAFVGDYEDLNSKFGKVELSIGRFDIIELGPIIHGKAGIFGGDLITFKWHKDSFDSSWDHQPELTDEIHTCGDFNREGCISGKSRIIQQTWYDWSAHARAEIFGFELFDFSKDLGDDEDYNKEDTVPFHQSLTWNEPLEYTEECPHKVYRVPVTVWGNEARTIRINGMTVKPSEDVQVDPNVRKYTRDISGSDNRGDGNATLFLPYKNGKYTIEAAGRGMTGSAEQPANMVKGRNERVHIVLKSDETKEYSVRKEWDIDYEDKDKPQYIEVLLQAQYYTHGKNIWSKTYGSIKSFASWEPVQLITLSEENNWQATFDEVPVWEVINEQGDQRKIKYRIRELRPESNKGPWDNFVDSMGQVFDKISNGRFLGPDDDEGAFPEPVEYEQFEDPNANLNDDERQQKLKDAGKRVVHWRWDLDNVNVYSVVKDRVTNWDQYWQIPWNLEAYLTGLAKSTFFPVPTVNYKVPEYTSSVGERIKEHTTKYVVEYSNEGDTTVIKNIAVMDVSIYKRWLNFSEKEETPESVWLVLQSRVKEKYLDLAGEAGKRMPYTPVWGQKYGNFTNAATLLDELVPGLGLIGKLDITGVLDIPIAIVKAKKNPNPLVSYRVKFGVKKYNVMKLPLDFRGSEVSSAIITDLIKALTTLDIPISISLTGGGYVTVPGKAYNFFKDYELASNVINVKADLPGGGDKEPTIGGTKYWKGDGWKIGNKDGDNLPEYLDIIVKDGETEIGRVRMNKKDQTAGADSWVWKLSQSDIDKMQDESEGGSSGDSEESEDLQAVDVIKLDPSKTYTITEEFPADYKYKDNYVASVDGHNITNTWTSAPSLVIEKKYEGDSQTPGSEENKEAKVKLTNDKGEVVGEYTLNEANNFKVTIKNKKASSGSESGKSSEGEYTAELVGHDINAFKIEEIDYDTEKYTPVYSGPSESEDDKGEKVYTFTVTNRVQKNVTVEIEKKWEGDEENKRPENVEIVLKRNGEEIITSSLTAEDDWKTTITKDSEGPLKELSETGEKYNYTIEEKTLENYSSKVESKEPEERGDTVYHSFTVTNKWTGGEDKVTVKGRKIWVDNNNEEDARPEKITVHVVGGSGVVKDVEVTADGNWEFSVSSLPRYDDDGNEIKYSLFEDDIEGYTVNYSTPSFNETDNTWTCDFSNTLTSSTISVDVTKEWKERYYDAKERKYKEGDFFADARPESIVVKLYGETGSAKREMAQATLTAADGWKHTFTGLKREERPGVAIRYTVEEVEVPNYTTEITGSEEEGFTITNTRKKDKYMARVKKIWDDDDNERGIRPYSVKVNLIQVASGSGDRKVYDTAVLTEENNWSCSFNDLAIDYPDPNHPMTKFGYQYFVEEETPPGYKYVVSTPAETLNKGELDFEFTVTNKIDPEQNPEPTDIPIVKQWEDDNNSSGRRPQSITVSLMDGDTEVRRMTMTASDASSSNANNWEKVFRNVPVRRSDGERIAFSIKEEAVAGYKPPVYSETDEEGIIKNEIDPSPNDAQFEVTKQWDDEESVERPSSVTVRLLNLDGSEADTGTITQADGWKYTFTGLDPEKEYSLQEVDSPGYVWSMGSKTFTEHQGVKTWHQTITNRRDKDVKAEFTVEKKWRNADDSEMTAWPEGKTIIAHLMKGNEEVAYIELNADKTSHTFRDLPAYDENGRIIAYSVTETVPDGYDLVPDTLQSERGADGTIQYSYTLINRAETGTIDIRVTKQWIGDVVDGNVSPNRPDAVTVHLYANGEEAEGSPAVVKKDDDWVYTFRNQPEYKDGTKVTYTVKEDVPQYYAKEPEITGSAENGFTIYNEWRYDPRDIIIRKLWNKLSGSYVTEPDSITVRLTLNGEPTEYAYVMSKGADGKWPDLTIERVGDNSTEDSTGNPKVPKNIVFDGVIEDPVAGYSASYVSRGNMFTITNTPQVAKYTFKKVWKDTDGTEISDMGQSVDVFAYRGDTMVGHVNLSASKGYEGEMLLPYLDENGNEIEYRFVEDPVPYKYTVSYGNIERDKKAVIGDYVKAAYKMTVTNTETNKTIKVKVRWDDGDNAAGIRPDSVKAQLLREDGKALPEDVNSEIEITSLFWQAYFLHVPIADEDGTEIEYTVAGEQVPGYSSTVNKISNEEFEIVYTPALNVRILVKWENTTEDQIPNEVHAFLYADNILQNTCTPAKGSNWEYTFIDLPVAGSSGQMIQYSATEEELNGFRTEVREGEVTKDSAGHLQKDITIINTPYDPVDVIIPVKKTVTGEPPSAETFTFRLTPNASGEGAQTVNITGAGEASFTTSHTKKGIYSYTLTEDAGTNSDYSYDGRTYVVMVNVSEGESGNLTASYTVNGNSGGTAEFVNRYQSETIDISGRKTWNDNSNEAGKRPVSITIKLLANGSEVDSKTVTSSDGWMWRFENKPKMTSDGNVITYTISEDPVADYKTEINGYNVTNTYEAPPVTPEPPDPDSEKVQITVIKVWDETNMPTPSPIPTPAITPMPADKTKALDDGNAESPEEPAADELQEEGGGEGAPVVDELREEGSGESAPVGEGTGENAEGEEEFEWPKRPESVTVHVQNGSEIVATETITESSGWQVTFEGLPYKDEGGNVIPYKITEDFVDGYDTTIGPVSNAGDSYTCTVTNTWTGRKTDIPTVTKKVKEKNDHTGTLTEWQDAADYDIGDSIPYRIVGTLPTRFAKYDHYTTYTFVDELSEGLDPPAATDITVRKNGEVDLSSKFNVTVSGKTITVSLKENEDMRVWEGDFALTNKDTIVIEYSAVLNENAKTGPEGNPNDVYLEYTILHDKDEYGTEKTEKDKVTVFTFTIKAEKQDLYRKPLEGAGFTLYKNQIPTEEQKENPKTEYTEATKKGDAVKDGDDYYIAVSDEITGEEVTTFTFSGVDAGVYRLVETTVPEGYTGIKPVDFRVIAYYETNAADPQLEVLAVNPPSGAFSVDFGKGEITGVIINSNETSLPSTGGPGTKNILLAGLAMMLASSLLLTMRRKKSVR